MNVILRFTTLSLSGGGRSDVFALKVLGVLQFQHTQSLLRSDVMHYKLESGKCMQRAYVYIGLALPKMVI